MVCDKNNIVAVLHLLLDHMAVCSPCCKIMRRDIIEQNNIRFDVNVSAGKDMLFVCDYFSAGLTKYVQPLNPCIIIMLQIAEAYLIGL